MVVERLATLALFFHDLRTRLRIGQGPLDYPISEQHVKQVLKAIGKVEPAPAGTEPSDAVEHLPDGDGGL